MAVVRILGLSLATIGGALLLTSLFVPWTTLKSVEYECDDFDYVTEDCDGEYIASSKDTVSLRASRAELTSRYLEDLEESDYEQESLDVQYSNDNLDDVDGIGRMRSFSPMAIAALSATLLGVVLVLVSLFVHGPLHVIGGGLLVACFILTTIATILLLTGMYSFAQAIKDDETSGNDEEFYTVQRDLAWHVGPFFAIAGGVLLLVGSALSFGRRAMAAVAASPTGPGAHPQPTPTSAGPAAAAPGLVRRAMCPRCRNTVEVPPGARPICWHCGYGS